MGEGVIYEAFSADYDRFVDWPARLAAEFPFIERELQAVEARRVLDAACGTGMHALALAERGYEVVGADLSAGMIRRAQANATAVGREVRFEVIGLGNLSARIDGSFDALLCLGNSLPHVLTPEDLAVAVGDFAACLRPGGLLLIQNRNFDALLARHRRNPQSLEARWMEPQSYVKGSQEEAEWLFLRFYDFELDGTLTFNLVTLRREGAGGWTQQVVTTKLWPWRRSELVTALEGVGFEEIVCWGDMQGARFDVECSPNLVVGARRARSD